MKDDDKTLLTIATLAVGALTLFGAYKQLSDRVKKDEQKTGSDTEPDIERKLVKPSEPEPPRPVQEQVSAPLITEKDFAEENRGLVFEPKAYQAEFMAEINNSFTKFFPKECFSNKWAYSGFPSGRYVILVYQRHSVYQNGKCIYENKNYVNSIGDYSRYHKPVFNVAAEEDTAYPVSTWGEHRLRSCIIMDPKHDNIIPAKYETAAEAAKAAKEYSLKGYKTAVIEWYADYDMY